MLRWTRCSKSWLLWWTMAAWAVRVLATAPISPAVATATRPSPSPTEVRYEKYDNHPYQQWYTVINAACTITFKYHHVRNTTFTHSGTLREITSLAEIHFQGHTKKYLLLYTEPWPSPIVVHCEQYLHFHRYTVINTFTSSYKSAMWKIPSPTEVRRGASPTKVHCEKCLHLHLQRYTQGHGIYIHVHKYTERNNLTFTCVSTPTEAHGEKYIHHHMQRYNMRNIFIFTYRGTPWEIPPSPAKVHQHLQRYPVRNTFIFKCRGTLWNTQHSHTLWETQADFHRHRKEQPSLAFSRNICYLRAILFRSCVSLTEFYGPLVSEFDSSITI